MRTWVLALLVVVSACSKKKDRVPAGGSGSAPAVASGSGSAGSDEGTFVASWTVTAASGVCAATEHGACPPDTECEPPPARAIACPAGLTDGTARVVQREDKTCAVVPGNQPTPCPLPKGEALPPLAWSVTAAPDGTCIASWASPATGTTSFAIKCPLAGVPSMTIERAAADAPCTVDHEGKAQAVPCPAEPKDFTVAALREALAKDAAPFSDQRVRVKGYYVKSMVAQKPVGGTTTYMLGVADPKGDTKTALRCTSIVALGEAADGDEVIVEGLAKRGTNNEVSLVECQASKP